jgi:uncharacterized protein YoxC
MVIEILLIILILAATALCLFVIVSLRKINLQIEQLQKDVKHVVENTIPLLNNLNDVTTRVNRVVTEAENYWDEIDSSIKNLKQKVSGLTSFTRFRDAENPTQDFIRNLKALSKGLIAFWNEFKRK